MCKPPRADEAWRLLHQLRRLVAERSPADAEIPADFAARNEAIKKKYQETWEALVKEYDAQKRAVETEYASARGAIIAEFGANHRATQREYDEVRREVLQRFKAAENDQKKKRQEAHWEATTVFEATKDGPDIERRAIEEQATAGQRELVAIEQDAVELLRRRWQWRDYPEPEGGPSPPEAALARFTELIDAARGQWRGLHYQRVPAMFEGGWPLGFLVLLWLAAVYPAGAALGWTNWQWVAASGAAAAVLWVALGSWLYSIAKKQSSEACTALRQTLREADLARHAALQGAKAECERKRAEIVRQLHDELRRADDEFSTCSEQQNRRRKSDVERIEAKYPSLLTEVAARRDGELQRAKTEYSRRLRELEAAYAERSARVLDGLSRELEESERRYARQWGEMAERWRSGMRRFQSDVDRINRQCRALFPDWDDPRWADWSPPDEVPPVISFGRLQADLNKIEDGMPEDEGLRPPQSAFSLPALFSFGERSLFMLKASGAGRDGAVAAIQAVMLRMLTSTRPGKVRFTIIDPVGLGENFSAFMHLADYDEQLVSNRIWTESGHIDRRLADLTEHMENVIQAYLRNEFDSIQQYNEFAGEMAEPYRVLVVANFPVNFSEIAARRLTSIVASGARCGVYTVLSVDTERQLPRDFRLADLEAHATKLDWEDGVFVWDRPGYGKEPVVLDDPPPPEQFTAMVRTVAGRLEDVDRVEVPFDCVVPDPEAWWTADSRGGVDVPLGRAGALKLQHLQLGKGTAQHVLIAGRTGSGKSTLLHALITSVALHYGPDEIELYLIDFKKGVEFKAFAGFELPHARVIAIESEREFGLSVLECLDEALKKRGDLFRKHGVQDVRGFRSAMPDARMPRVLLIVDEFQELFVEDDRIAQDAALLLDRLVRQGRAFGIHVLLGSQTLAGAYSLPRSTIGQMAVRIALQCSEADAHLILSEENTAARLLTRPGEAIYNDANGMFEGNHPFQVAWLSDAQREAYLDRIRQLAARKSHAAEPAIVFEGNVPADPGQNPFLREILESPSRDGAQGGARAWLGASVAIKSPTVARFSRQGGSNLLIVGHREEEALGVMAASLVALAAQGRPCRPGDERPGASFYVFDGTRPDAPEVGFWERLATVLPHSVQVARPRDAEGPIAEVAAELARRQEAGDEEAAPVYLLIYNLVRFRALRKADDDFSFSRMGEDKPPDAATQLGNVLREGPAFGIHALVWCDTYNTVHRWLDRQSLRDMEMRVLFQMNASDSSSLIDSPAASRLGVHRAVLYSEEQGRLEKFRPYGVPSDAWLKWVQERLHDRAPDGGADPPDAAVKEGSSTERP